MSERFKILNDYEVLNTESNMVWRKLYAEQMSKKRQV
jgi:hypothetical protein